MITQALNILFEPFNWCPIQCVSCPQGRRELPLDKAVLQPEEEALIRGESNAFQLVQTPEALAIAKGQPAFTCPIQTSEFRCAKNGDVTGCTAAGDQTPIGNIFEHSVAEILRRKENFSLCKSCYESGAYKICCGLNVAVDRRAARRAGGGLRKQLGYGLEAARKVVWKRLERRSA